MGIVRIGIVAAGLATWTITPAVAQQTAPTNGRSIATLAKVPLKSRDGTSIRFGSRVARGKPTLVAFWSSWCLPCVAEAPYLNRIRKDLGDRYTFLYIDRREGDPDPNQPPAAVAQFLSRAGMADMEYVVADVAASRRILGEDVRDVPPGKVGIPRIYLFDRHGRQIYTSYGFAEAEGAKLVQRVREAVEQR